MIVRGSMLEGDGSVAVSWASLRCRNGPALVMTGGAAVPQRDGSGGVRTGRPTAPSTPRPATGGREATAAGPQGGGADGGRAGRPQASARDSHGTLCRDRRVAGTEQRVRGRGQRADRARGQGLERARGAGRVLGPAWRAADPDRAGGGAALAVAACRADGCRVRGGAAGDPAREWRAG